MEKSEVDAYQLPSDTIIANNTTGGEADLDLMGDYYQFYRPFLWTKTGKPLTGEVLKTSSLNPLLSLNYPKGGNG